MDVKDLNLHLDNFVSGAILATECWVLSHKSIESDAYKLTSSDAFNAVMLVCLSYGIGVIAATIARFFVDGLSERGPRTWMLRWLAHRDEESLKLRFGNDREYEEDWEREQKKWTGSSWNCIYRAALRQVMIAGTDEAKRELSRRRAQGRLVRNLVLPIALTPFVACNLFGWTVVSCHLVLSSILFIGFGILLYAYAEFNNFAEAIDILSSRNTVECRCTTRLPTNLL